MFILLLFMYLYVDLYKAHKSIINIFLFINFYLILLSVVKISMKLCVYTFVLLDVRMAYISGN